VKKRVVITGMGVISPIGIGNKNFAQSLKAGTSGVGPITLFDASPFPTRIAAEVKGFDPHQILKGTDILGATDDRRVLFAHAAASLALDDAKLNAKKIGSIRGGVVFGSGIHPIVPSTETIISQGIIYRSESEMKTVMKELEEKETSPAWNRVSLGTTSVAQHYGIKGPCYTIVSACAASSQAMGQSFRIIQRGDADLILTGGYDSMIFPFAIQGFCSLGTMSSYNEHPQKAMKPFDRKRDGFVLGEGSGVVILEELEHARKRGAKIYAEVAGYGSSLDAYSVADPHPKGSGAILSMKKAIEDAGINPSDIEYINTHGTATVKNDRIETAAIKEVLGDHAYEIPISSTKSMIGHQVAAAGALELIATVLAMDNDFIPPTINYETPDPDCDLDYVPNRAREKPFNSALSNSFGFGGQNSTICIKKVPELN
jgi:3-oxoacyl-[acyl-carrier-protein] synthase II